MRCTSLMADLMAGDATRQKIVSIISIR